MKANSTSKSLSRLLAFVCFIILFDSNLFSQTITSTTSGGLWSSTTTWVGGVVPSSINNIVIDGNVYLNTNTSCVNLTVNSGDTLMDNAGSYSLTVNGNVINNGAILRHPSGWYGTFDIKGNITNNGSWSPYQTTLSGSGIQTLTATTGKTFGGIFRLIKSDSYTRMMSNITFSGDYIDLNADTLHTNGYTLSIIETSIYNGIIWGNDSIVMNVKNRSTYTLNFIGDVKIKGPWFYEQSIVFTGKVTVYDTLMNRYGSYTLTVDGDIVNNGYVIRDPGSWYNNIVVSGNIENNGKWSPFKTKLNGSQLQSLKQSSGKMFEGEWNIDDTLSYVQLTSNVNFSGILFFLNSDTLSTNGYTLTVNETDFANGTILSNDTIRITNKTKSWHDITFIGNIKLKGNWYYDHNNTFIGKLTNYDTLMNRYGSYTLTVNGDVVNYGAILRDPQYWYNNVDITGNIENYGKWSPYYTRLTGTQVQNIKQGTGTWFEGNWLFSDTNSFVRLTGDVNFKGGTLDMNKDSLVTNGFKLNILSSELYNGTIVSNDTITINNNQYALHDMTFRGNVVLNGKVWYQHNNFFFGTCTILDTFINNYGSYTITFNGNMINKGAVLRDPSLWYNNIDVTGNIENYGKWKPYYTRLTGTQVQGLKQGTGKVFEGSWLFSDTNSYVQLLSNINFSSAYIELNKDSLLTNSFKLNLLSSDFMNGTIISNDTIIINNNRAQFRDLTFRGNTVFDGKIWYQQSNFFYGTVTFLDTLIDNSGSYTITFNGNVVNRKAMLRAPESWYNNVDVTGTIENYGSWKPYMTRLIGNQLQTLKQSTGKSFESNWLCSDTNSYVQLGSDVNFNNASLNMNYDTLKTNGYKFNMLSSEFYYATVLASDTITINNNRYSFRDVTFKGDVSLKGKAWYQQGINFENNLTVLDTMIDNSGSYAVTVKGNFAVKGAYLRDPSSWYNTLNIYGNMSVDGIFNCYQTYIRGTQPKNISGRFANVMQGIFTIDDSISLTGENTIPSISYSGLAKSSITILPAASLNIPSGSNVSKIYNYGRVTYTQEIDTVNEYNYDYYFASLQNYRNRFVNKISIDHYGYQQHPTANGAINEWWRLRNSPQLFNDSLKYLKLRYNHQMLNGNRQDSIKVFYSPNAGMVWKNLKSGVSIDTVADMVTITNAPSYGHYLLATSALGILTFHPTIERAEPKFGGNTGHVTMYVFGAGFKPTSIARLTRTGFTDVKADTTYITDAVGESVLAYFNLKGVSAGVWNLVITTPGDSTLILNNYFTVQPGERSKPWVALSARDRFLINRWQTFNINYGNTSNTDALGTVLVFAVNDLPGLEVAFPDFRFILPKSITDMGPGYSRIPDSVAIYYTTTTLKGHEGISMRVYPLYVPVIGAGTAVSKRLRVKLNGAGTLNLKVWMLDPLYETIDYYGKTSEPIPLEVSNCMAYAAMKYAFPAVIGMIPGMGCIQLGTKVAEKAYDVGDYVLNGPGDAEATTLGSFLWGAVSWGTSIAQCATSFIPGVGAAVQIGTGLAGMIVDVGDNYDAKEECWRKFKKKSQDKRDSRGVTSFDPNEMVGPQGYGTDHYISKKGNINYRIYFENKATAGAPALEVFVYDTIDKSKYNLKTFSFEKIQFGDTNINVQAFAKEFSLLVDLYPSKSIIVNIRGKLDTATGIISWSFHSLDRLTLELTEDPDLGFLPPNISSPQGEGSVGFSCAIDSTLIHNTQIKNKATIIFDLNPPIVTNEYVNTIDAQKPVSSVNSLNATQTDTVINVSWYGSDGGSGIASYTIFVSVNDSTFQVWKSSASVTSDKYNGKVNSKYKFYCVAVDSVGLTESKFSMTEATTTITKPTSINDVDEIVTTSISVYPNPIGSQLHVELKMKDDDAVSVYITDITGRSVELNKNLNIHAGKHDLVYNTSDLRNGLYFITVLTSKDKWTKGITILK